MRIVTPGKNITTSGTSASSIVPFDATGRPPRRLRIAASAAAYVRLGTARDVSAAIANAGTGYRPGDRLTLVGGTYFQPALIEAASVKLESIGVDEPGQGYAPGDEITLAGGQFGTAAIVAVASTQVVGIEIVATGANGTPGTATIAGTTGTGTEFEASVTINDDGELASIDEITVAGAYTVNPTDPGEEPVTGGDLEDATVALTLGVLTVSVDTAGNYIGLADSFTQASTDGDGLGATFDGGVFELNAVRVAEMGAYSSFPSNAVASTHPTGSGATFNMTWTAAAVAGDILVVPDDAIVVESVGTHAVSAIQVSGAGVVNVCAIED